MLLPFSATLQKQYRDTLETSSAPTEIETSQPVMPVAVVAQVNTNTSASYVRVTDGTDNLSVNTDGSINVLDIPLGATYINAIWGSTAGAVASGTAVHTVTAGKNFYILGFIMGNTGALNTCAFNWGGSNKIVCLVPATSSVAVMSSKPMNILPAGTAITVVCSVAGNILQGTMFGYEL